MVDLFRFADTDTIRLPKRTSSNFVTLSCVDELEGGMARKGSERVEMPQQVEIDLAQQELSPPIFMVAFISK